MAKKKGFRPLADELSRPDNDEIDLDDVSPTIQAALKRAGVVQEKEEEESAPKLPFGITAVTPRKEPAKARKKDTHRSGPKAVFRCIPPRVKTKVDELADAIDAPVGLVARYMFERGLEDIESGQLVLVPLPSINGLTLYPAEQRRAGRPTSASRQRMKSGQIAFHGVPPDLVERIRVVANEHHINIGEVARKLLEHGLELHSRRRRLISREVIISYARNIYDIPDAARR